MRIYIYYKNINNFANIKVILIKIDISTFANQLYLVIQTLLYLIKLLKLYCKTKNNQNDKMILKSLDKKTCLLKY
jgi:hypothetical protein